MSNKKKEVEILLVEDNTNDAELVIRSLRKVNLTNKLVHLKDGVEALEFLFRNNDFTEVSEHLPRVILLDIKMPRIDGIEVLRKIKSNPVTKFIPVVIMTSSKEEQDIVKSYELGVNSYIVKPVEFTGFAKAVSELGMYWMLINQPAILLAKEVINDEEI